MNERREGNLQCLEDISIIKAWTCGIKDDVIENKDTLKTQGKELMDLKLEVVSLRSERKMTNKILIGGFSIAGIIAGIVFGILEYFKISISG